jgi:hypothetical protein
VPLATTVNLIAALVAFGVGAWLILAGLVGLSLGKFEPLRAMIGEALFIRCAVAMILIGMILFMAGAGASARIMS